MSREVREEILSIAAEIKTAEKVGFRNSENHSLQGYDGSGAWFYLGGPRPYVNIYETRNVYSGPTPLNDAEEARILEKVRQIKAELV